MTVIPSPRLRLEEWGRAWPGIWRAAMTERDAWVAEVSAPEIFLPMEHAARATMAALDQADVDRPSNPGELAPLGVTTQCLAAWRMTEGIYRIDRTLYEALIETPVTGEIPTEVLLRLPEWCVYIETPGMTAPLAEGSSEPVLGLWYWLDVPARGGAMMLCIGIDLGAPPPMPVQHVPLVGTIEAAIDETMRPWQDTFYRHNAGSPPPRAYRDTTIAWLPPALSLILYLCSRAAEISGPQGAPGNPAPTRTRRGEKLFAADRQRIWDVGVRLGGALRTAYDREAVVAGGVSSGGARQSPRPHVRGAHWHTFLSGPRKDRTPADRRRDLRWLPPIPVRIEDYDALPAVVHPVRLPRSTG